MPRAIKSTDNLATPAETPIETPAPQVTAEPAVPPTKPKRVITEKQREALMKGQETRNANRAVRKAENEAKAVEDKKAFEERLLQKAEQIKKKTEKKMAVIESISDAEESADEDIMKPAEKARPPSTIKPAKPAKSAKPAKKVKKIVVIESDDGSTDSEDYARSVDEMDSEEEVVYVAKSHSKKREKKASTPLASKPVIRFI